MGINSSATLADKIVLITGSTRGIGRGIALTLASQGATIYITGRSSSGGSTTENLPGTVESVAAEVNERGGRGIPVAIDLRDDAKVAQFLERIAAEQSGRLDLLVNNV